MELPPKHHEVVSELLPKVQRRGQLSIDGQCGYSIGTTYGGCSGEIANALLKTLEHAGVRLD